MELEMADSKRIAALLGPTLIALAISEAMNLRNLAEASAPVGLVYLNGTLLFVAGVAILRDHNRWRGGWPVLVTVLGWFAVLGGLIRMFLPAAARSGAPWVYALLIVLLTIGVVLTFKAYAREN
jgi:hypothetical protein